MSDELKLLDCPFCGCEPDFLLDSDNCPYVECHSCHFAMPAYRPGFEHMAIAAWNRRTTPVSAPLDTQALPEPDVCAYHDGYMSAPTAYSRAKVEQIVAKRDERIAHLERELELAHCAFIGSENARKNAERAAEAERKLVSISDDPEFEDLAGDVYRAGSYNESIEKSLNALIAYIDGRTAGTAPAPQFNSEDGLVAWLDTMYECDSNGAIHNRKWESAQRAITGIRAIEAKAVSSMDRAQLQIEVFKLRAAINATELEGGYKLVPVEPTDEMRTACKVLNDADDIDAEWARMLAAAPSPLPPKEETK